MKKFGEMCFALSSIFDNIGGVFMIEDRHEYVAFHPYGGYSACETEGQIHEFLTNWDVDAEFWTVARISGDAIVDLVDGELFIAKYEAELEAARIAETIGSGMAKDTKRRGL